MSDEKRCFYCGATATIWIVKVGHRDYPICRECKFNEASKDAAPVRPK